jgi:uncharacterized membrane protein
MVYPSAIKALSSTPAKATQILFTIPFFKWDNPRNGWVLKAPFILYWEITMPITGFMITLFSIWFYVMYDEDKKAERDEARRKREKEGDAARERSRERREIAEDNEAAEALKKRYREANPEGESQ